MVRILEKYDQIMYGVVHFDALALESDFRIERRQVAECWIRISSRLNARGQTD